MKLSEKRKAILFNAIADNVMDLRLKVQNRHGEYKTTNLDTMLFNLQMDIWRNVKQALNLVD